MAQQTSVSLVDDLDGSKAAETVAFGLDGSSFEIDLSKKNAAALRKALTEFVEHGRRVKRDAPCPARIHVVRLRGPARLPRTSGNGRSVRGSPSHLVAGSPPTSSHSTKRPTPDPRIRP